MEGLLFFDEGGCDCSGYANKIFYFTSFMTCGVGGVGETNDGPTPRQTWLVHGSSTNVSAHPQKFGGARTGCTKDPQQIPDGSTSIPGSTSPSGVSDLFLVTPFSNYVDHTVAAESLSNK